MDQNWSPGSSAVSRRGHSFRKAINRDRLTGLAAIVIGLSQLPLAFMFADATGYEISIYAIGAGGWLLITIGVNVFRGREAFEVDWSDSNRVAWFSAIMSCLLAAAVAVAVLLIVT